MRRIILLLIASLIVAIGAPANYHSNILLYQNVEIAAQEKAGRMVVNNLSSGTITVIDTKSDKVTGTFSLPPGANPPEPMYVLYSPGHHRVFVSDHANKKVIVFDAEDFHVEKSIDVGDGPFHMWADPSDSQLWVVNENDKTCTVIDPISLEFLATVPVPADLVAKGGRPHDVVLDPTGTYAYITVTRLVGDDFVVAYSMETFREVRRAAVQNDHLGSFVHLHVCLTPRNNMLYLPRQGSNVVTVLDRNTLEHITEIQVPGAHGARMGRKEKFFYTTNIPGGGPAGIFVIDVKTNRLIGQAVDTPYPTPHNVALTPNGRKLYLTHSGPTSTKVTIYKISKKSPIPALIGEVDVGANPFGLAYVP
jgi:DNA-binding beta-propeller fold protein YncE